MGLSFAGCLAVETFCCLGSTACKCFFTIFKCSSSTATRVVYATLFLLNAMISWLMLSDWAIRELKKSFDRIPYYHIDCPEGTCYGTLATYRMTFASFCFHLILALLTIGVHSTTNVRSGIQNGYWGPKIVIYIGIIIGAFYLPNEFFTSYAGFAMIFSGFFILIQLILLIDMAYKWSGYCLAKFEENEDKRWLYFLASCTILLFIASLVGTILLFIYFGSSECKLNQFFISFNLILSFIIAVVSVHPRVQEENPQSGWPQCSIVCIYTIYLVSSALMNEPEQKCNPLLNSYHYILLLRSQPRVANIFIGALLTFGAVVYTTSSAASSSHAFSGEDNVALLPMSDTENVEDFDDEANQVQYNYSFYHIVFALASMYMAMLLTNWDSIDLHDKNAHYSIGQSWQAVWVKIVTGWICTLMYLWTLIAPIVLPDRDWN